MGEKKIPHGVLVLKPEGTTLENLVVGERVILKLMLQEKIGGCGLDSCGSG
jgi:hypothetical protein